MLIFSVCRPLERPTENFVQRRQVGRSADWRRVDGLPRRDWQARVEAEHLVEKWTARFIGPFDRGQRLLPAQAACLQEASEEHGLVAALSVGSGKTLLSFLLPSVIPCDRPALVLKASLIDKTRAEWLEYAKDWRLARPPDLVSYESLGTVGGKDLLSRAHGGLGYDLLIFDEIQKLKDARASRTRRVRRYLSEGRCNAVGMTGSLAKRSVKDFAHWCLWCLGPGAPVPVDTSVLEDWSAALDEKLMVGQRIGPGCLLDWAVGETGDELRRARRGFFRRFSETPGVICSTVSAADLGVGISVTGHRVNWPDDGPVGEAFERLRTLRELPDGQELVDAIEWWQHAQELAHGYYLHWRDPAPKPWLAARKAWFSHCREVLSRSKHIDSPDELAKCYPDAPEWVAWKEIRDSYKPVTVPVWLDTGVAELAAAWLTDGGGIVFTNNTCFGQLVGQLAGVPYFGAEGRDELGRSIAGWTGRACAASFRANFEGRNLQHLHRMLIPMPPPNGLQWEQLLGRLHRQGQAKNVEVDVYLGCKEAYEMLAQSLRDAEGVQNDLLGGQSKLSIARVTYPPMPVDGWQWCDPPK